MERTFATAEINVPAGPAAEGARRAFPPRTTSGSQATLLQKTHAMLHELYGRLFYCVTGLFAAG